MKVAVRIRPFNRQEMEANQRIIVRVIDEQNLLFDPDDDEDEFFFHGSKMKHRDITKRVRKKLPMEYDHVFGAEATNDDIYERCMKPLISSVMDGYNCSVFVYGATGAGKTFTMLGKENVPGITYLTIQELFRQMEELSDERKFDIGVSYLEVYNEQVMNLLTKVGPLKLREDSSGVVVSGLSLKPIFSSKELIGLLAQGNLNRTQHPTDANAESSRSHAIFQVHIRMGDRKTGQKRTVKLSMIDLAGSERASSTKGIGVRFKEGASINKSLLALGNCINKLADGIAHIPYRDSNLTRILKDSLGGNCQTVMIANVSPSSLMYDDTYNTLKYASRAKKIRIACKQNVLRANLPAEFYAKKTVAQEEEIEALKKLVKQLEERNAIQAGEIKRLEAENGANQENIQPKELSREASSQPDLKETYRRIDRIYEEIRSAMTTLIKINSKQNILILKTKFKKCIEEQKKLLYLDGTQMNSDSLGGNCQTVMIANVSPSSLMYDDTYNTLKYASRAKKIRIACKQNVLRANLPAEFYAKKTVAQEEEIEALKKLVKQLEERNAIQVAEIKRLEAENGANQENIQPRELSREAPAQPDLKETYRRIDRIYEEIRSAMTTLIQINSKQNILILKTKFKKCIEEQKKLLYLDGTQMNSKPFKSHCFEIIRAKKQAIVLQKLPTELPEISHRRCISLTQRWDKSKDKKKDKKPGKVEINEEILREHVKYEALLGQMEKAIENLKEDYIRNISLRSSTGALEELKVRVDGKEHKLQELGQIIRKNPQVIVINLSGFPQTIPAVLGALQKSGMNLNPQQDGTTLFVTVPPVTKEHREQLAKGAKALFIKCRDTIRTAQNDTVKKIRKSGSISEDVGFSIQQQVVAIGDKFVAEAEKIHDDISRLEASIDKYSRQVDDQKKMMDEWQGKYQALVMELDALRQDIQGTAGQEMVEMYMKAKERERTIMYQDQRHLHINKMMTLIKNDMESSKAAQLMGCELVQQMYLLMRANNVAMDVNLKRKLQKLAKLIEGKASIKFADDDQEDSFEALSKIRVLDFDVAVVGVGGGKRMLEDDSMGMPAKRKRLLMDEAAASTSLPPVPLFAPPNPNETHVMSGVAPLEDAPAAQEMNHTFRVSTVLTDQKRNLSGNSTKAHAVRSSPKRLAGLSKATNNENKRNSPYRVKKSPRTMKRPIPIAKAGLPFRNGINALQKKESAVQKFWK
uniref:Ribosome-recycling factor, mitochondrial n=1 Tax=Lutzomyia longipalpis TaxID=7200 RepID=A0A7G3AN06_LUTLO